MTPVEARGTAACSVVRDRREATVTSTFKTDLGPLACALVSRTMDMPDTNVGAVPIGRAGREVTHGRGSDLERDDRVH